MCGTDDINRVNNAWLRIVIYDADEWSNRVRVVTDVDLWVVSKTLVAGSLIGNTSSTLKIRGVLDFQFQISIRSMLLENLTLTNTFCCIKHFRNQP